MRLGKAFNWIQKRDRSFGQKAWWRCFLFLVVFKLVLVAHSEIKTGIYDEFGYANSSLHWFGEANAEISNFQRPPGLPVFAQVARAVGLPYRMAIEIMLCGSIGLLSFRLSRLIASYLIGIILSGLLIFHPWLFDNASSFMSEPLFAAESLCWLACLAALLETNAWGWKSRWLWASGICLFLMAVTRLEDPVIVGFAVVGWLGLVWAARLNPSSTSQRGFSLLWATRASLLIPLVVVFAGKELVCLINYAKCGVAATCYLEAPGLTHLLQTLNEIQAPDPQRFVPITTRSFEMAMEASPSLRLLQEPISRHQVARKMAKKYFLHGQEGWFLMWDLIYSSMEVQSTVPHGSQAPKTLDTYWQQCGDELQAALKEGKLPRANYAPYPLNPNYRLWIGYYPQAWWKEIRSLCKLRVKPAEESADSAAIFSRYPWSETAFTVLNDTANRSPALLPSTFLDGYAYSKRGPVDDIFLEDSKGTLLGHALTLTPELLPAELARLVPTPPADEVPCRYTITLPYAVPPSARLILIKDGQRISAQPISEVYHVESGGAPNSGVMDGMAEIRSKVIRGPDANHDWRAHLQAFILRNYRWFETLACVVCFFVALASALHPGSGLPSPGKLALLLGIMFACLFLRCSFYALSEACALPNWDRYPRALSLWVTILLLGGSWLCGRFFAIRKR